MLYFAEISSTLSFRVTALLARGKLFANCFATPTSNENKCGILFPRIGNFPNAIAVASFKSWNGYIINIIDYPCTKSWSLYDYKIAKNSTVIKFSNPLPRKISYPICQKVPLTLGRTRFSLGLLLIHPFLMLSWQPRNGMRK